MDSKPGKPGLKLNGFQTPPSKDLSTSGLATPSDNELVERNLAALDRQIHTKLHISIDNSITAPKSSLKNAVAGDSPATPTSAWRKVLAASDPLSDTALGSPLHTEEWDAYVTSQGGSLSDIARAPVLAPTGTFENFKRAGPRCPPSLEKLIMDYHHRHSKSWQLAHDMGAGSGIFSPALAKYFRHVHVSNPSADGTTATRRHLSTWTAANRKSRGRFTFSTGIPERGHETMADGTADLVVVMQGAHFAEPTALVLSAAESLAPTGTLAIVSYSPVCRVTGNTRADAVAQRLFASWSSRAWDVVCGEDAKSKQRFSSGLNFVPIPEQSFALDKTRRIQINAAHGSGFEVPGVTPGPAESRVRPGERKHVYTSDEEEGKGWKQQAGPEYFRSLTAALLGSTETGKMEKQFKELAQVVHETSPSGILIELEWKVAVILATKK